MSGGSRVRALLTAVGSCSAVLGFGLVMVWAVFPRPAAEVESVAEPGESTGQMYVEVGHP